MSNTFHLSGDTFLVSARQDFAQNGTLPHGVSLASIDFSLDNRTPPCQNFHRRIPVEPLVRS